MSIPTSGTYVFSVYALQDGTFEYPTGEGARFRFNIDDDKNYCWTSVSVTFYGNVLVFTDASGEVHAISYAPRRTYGQKTYGYDSVILTSTNSPYRHYILSAEPPDAIAKPQSINYYPNGQAWSLGPRVYSKDYSTDGAFVDIVCFLKDTCIAVPDGYRRVQDICVGDRVITRVGNHEKFDRVTWVGKATCVVRPHLPDDLSGAPVRIRENAFASGVPSQDLYITSEHCIYCDGVFIPVRMLVNGLSILYDTTVSSYDYYHIETEQHSIIKANDLYTESYLDTGNRAAFSSTEVIGQTTSSLKSWGASSAAPLAVSRGIVEPLHHELQQRCLDRLFLSVPGAAAV